MLEVGVGLLAGLLLVMGFLIMAGPTVSRTFRLLLRRRSFKFSRPSSAATQANLHPTTGKALAAAGRLAEMLKEQGMDRHVSALRHAGAHSTHAAFGGEPIDVQVRRRREVVGARLGARALALDDAAQAVEHGVRFFRVSHSGKIREIGYFMPAAAQSSNPYWLTKRLLYVVDYNRGIDLLRYTGKL